MVKSLWLARALVLALFCGSFAPYSFAVDLGTGQANRVETKGDGTTPISGFGGSKGRTGGQVDKSGFMKPLQNVVNAVTGPLGKAITVVGLVAGGAALIFGRNEMNEFIKTIVNVVVVGSLLILAIPLIEFMFGATVSVEALQAITLT